MAAEVSEARSKRPATGFATVLTTPLARPVKNPWKFGRRGGGGGGGGGVN